MCTCPKGMVLRKRKKYIHISKRIIKLNISFPKFSHGMGIKKQVLEILHKYFYGQGLPLPPPCVHVWLHRSHSLFFLFEHSVSGAVPYISTVSVSEMSRQNNLVLSCVGMLSSSELFSFVPLYIFVQQKILRIEIKRITFGMTALEGSNLEEKNLKCPDYGHSLIHTRVAITLLQRTLFTRGVEVKERTVTTHSYSLL